MSEQTERLMQSLADPSVRVVYGRGSAAARSLGFRVRIRSGGGGGGGFLSFDLVGFWGVRVLAPADT